MEIQPKYAVFVFLFSQKITFGPIWVGTQKGSKLDPHGPKGSPIGPKGSPRGPKGPFGGRRPTKGTLGPYWGPSLLSPLGGYWWARGTSSVGP